MGNSAQKCYKKGEDFEVQHQYEKALDLYQQALNLDSSFQMAQYKEADILQILGHKQEALKKWILYIQTYPDDQWGYNNLGLLYYDTFDYEKSIECYNKAVQLDKNEGCFYHNRGLAYQYNYNLQEAVKDFDKALEIHEDLILALSEKALVYVHTQQYDKAVQFMPNLQEKLQKLSDFHLSAGQQEDFIRTVQIIEVYEELVKENQIFLNSELRVENLQKKIQNLDNDNDYQTQLKQKHFKINQTIFSDQNFDPLKNLAQKDKENLLKQQKINKNIKIRENKTDITGYKLAKNYSQELKQNGDNKDQICQNKNQDEINQKFQYNQTIVNLLEFHNKVRFKNIHGDK
ncbi:hypothetical protein PPERSA_04635 [Pseudocohnilembus persalinus]|uniref:Uncharacterized protein n=1 Tax=Pseudocohnilembus persalinus TaxID=266149 RepID=A0A0V0QPB0_PSEPJ|nr:hypothetical protein PPERSA_04635 [Pseudocohnilembus persalinus]|eukprot:KRX03840.1 hypothetical protein PPERSA_04635 [Pseudocohnilembus persalinus]